MVDLHDDGRYTVMFDSYDDETHEVGAEDIIPAGRRNVVGCRPHSASYYFDRYV